MNFEFLWFRPDIFKGISKLNDHQIDKLFIIGWFPEDWFQYHIGKANFDFPHPSKIVFLFIEPDPCRYLPNLKAIILERLSKFTILRLNDNYIYQNFNFIYSNATSLIIGKPNKFNIVMSSLDLSHIAINDLVRKSGSETFINLVLEPKYFYDTRRICVTYGYPTIESTRYLDRKFKPIRLTNKVDLQI